MAFGCAGSRSAVYGAAESRALSKRDPETVVFLIRHARDLLLLFGERQKFSFLRLIIGSIRREHVRR